MNYQPPKQTNYMVYCPKYSEVYGKKLEIDEIRQGLPRYNAISLVCFLSGITLYLTRNVDPLIKQKVLMEIIFPDTESTLLNCIQRQRNKRFAVFSDLPLLNLIKLAMMNCSINQGITEYSNTEFEEIGKWILILNEDLDIEKSSLIIPKEIEWEKTREFATREYFFKNDENINYRIIRYKRMFECLCRNPSLKAMELFTEAMQGTNYDEYFHFNLYLVFQWVHIITTQGFPGNKPISISYLIKMTGLSKECVQKIMAILSLRIECFEKDYLSEVNNELAGKDIFSFNFLLLRKCPLILISEDLFLFPSINILVDRMTEGVYWIIENKLKRDMNTDSNAKKKRNLLSQLWGEAYEEYIVDRFHQGFSDQYFWGRYKDNDQGKWGDGILIGKDVICMIEAKFARWTLTAKLTGKREDMKKVLGHLFNNTPKKEKGLAQIVRNIQDYKSGKWKPLFNFKNKQFLPILVVGESVPVDLVNRKLYEEFAMQAGIKYQAENILPFIFLGSEEVEILEAFTQQDGPEYAINLLKEYALSFQNISQHGFHLDYLSFKNYIHSKNLKLPDNQRLSREYKGILDKSFEIWKSNAT